jgi:hypothetical protein
MKTRLAWAMVALGGVLAVGSARASWAYVPLIQRVAEADLIVAGKMGKIGEDFQRDKREYAIGVIQVSEVLKGDKATRTARLAFANPNRKVHSTVDIAFREGQEGVWVLRRDKAGDFFTASYPTDFQAADQKAVVTREVERIKALRWGKQDQGLALAVLVEHRPLTAGTVVKVKGRTVSAKEELEVIVFARNECVDPIHLVDYPPDAPVKVKVTESDGREQDLDWYPSYQDGRAPALTNWHVKAVSPGGMLALGHLRVFMTEKTGVFKVGAVYENKRDAKELGLTRVWMGRIESPVIEEQVPQSAGAATPSKENAVRLAQKHVERIGETSRWKVDDVTRDEKKREWVVTLAGQTRTLPPGESGRAYARKVTDAAQVYVSDSGDVRFRDYSGEMR